MTSWMRKESQSRRREKGQMDEERSSSSGQIFHRLEFFLLSAYIARYRCLHDKSQRCGDKNVPVTRPPSERRPRFPTIDFALGHVQPSLCTARAYFPRWWSFVRPHAMTIEFSPGDDCTWKQPGIRKRCSRTENRIHTCQGMSPTGNPNSKNGKTLCIVR